MECENLPSENASEPIEEAHQPRLKENMSAPNKIPNQRKNNVTFSEDTHCTEISSSQGSSQHKEALSQPPGSLTHRQRMQWLQQHRGTGLWANCDTCARWRYLPHILDAHELPAKWYCKMNPDTSANNCSVREAPLHIRDEEDLIHAEYSAGSVVWARLAGYPAWPAMVDDCPDTEQFYWLDGFSDIPTHYNVVFFDDSDVTRAWIAPENLMPYACNKKVCKLSDKDKKYKKRLEAAMAQADDADSLPLKNRLAKYSFIARYPGSINNPRKISKKDLQKFQNKLKRKFNIEFDNESASESDDDLEPRKKTQCAKKDKQKVVRKSKTLNTSENKKIATKEKQEKHITTDFAETDKVFEDLNNNNLINMEPKDPPNDVNNIESSENVIEVGKNKDVNTETKTPNQEPSDGTEDSLKQPADSMVVQIGSTGPTVPQTAEMSVASFDNDTSNTYVPESQTVTESETVTTPMETLTTLREKTVSSCSDDFEF